MALKAIVEYDKLRSNSNPGAITILLDGKQIAEIEVNEKSPAVRLLCFLLFLILLL